MARRIEILAVLSACALVACSAPEPAAVAPVPEPETVFSSEDEIEGMAVDGDAIDLELFAQGSGEIAARLVRVDGAGTDVLAEDAFPQEAIMPHESVVDYLGVDGADDVFLRRVRADGTIDTLWPTYDWPSIESDGFLYGASPFVVAARELWRVPEDGPYEIEPLAVFHDPEQILDQAVSGASAWISVDDCGLGWFDETAGLACNTRLERIDLEHIDAGPEIVATHATHVEGYRVDNLRAEDPRVTYLFEGKLYVYDAVSRTDAVLADDIDFTFGIRDHAAVALQLRGESGRGEILVVPLDGGAPTQVAEVPPLGAWSALGRDALFLTDEHWHAVYRVPLP